MKYTCFFFILFAITLSCSNNKVTEYTFPENEVFSNELFKQLDDNIKDSTILIPWKNAIINQQYSPLFTSKEDVAKVKETLQLPQKHGLDFLVQNELSTIDTLLQKINLNTLTIAELCQEEIRYRTALTNYSKALEFGVINPNSLYAETYQANAIQADSLWFANEFTTVNYSDHLSKKKVNNPFYNSLLERYNSIDTTNTHTKLTPPKKGVKVGHKYKDAPLLRKRFNLEEIADSSLMYVYDKELSKQIKKFQQEHALYDDGVIGGSTIKMLNETPNETKQKMETVLERLRWNNGQSYENAYLVNVPEYRLYIIENKKIIDTFNVCVGLAKDHQTPEFIDTLKYIVLNPTWRVPYSISSEELLLKQQRDSTFFTRNNYTIELNKNEVSPNSVDWASYTPETFPFKVTQQSGRGNALGKIKFLFPNKNAIYIHDTPSKRAFKASKRAVSHGCIRVQDPFRLGNFVMNNNKTYKRAKRQSELKQMTAKKKYPVIITYITTMPQEEGVHNVQDVYGKDAILQKAWLDLKQNQSK